jgi:hypothetical protein
MINVEWISIQIRNPNIETRNNIEYSKSKNSKHVYGFGHCNYCKRSRDFKQERGGARVPTEGGKPPDGFALQTGLSDYCKPTGGLRRSAPIGLASARERLLIIFSDLFRISCFRRKASCGVLRILHEQNLKNYGYAFQDNRTGFI